MTRHRPNSYCPICKIDSLNRPSGEKCRRCKCEWIAHDDRKPTMPCQECDDCPGFVSKCDEKAKKRKAVRP